MFLLQQIVEVAGTYSVRLKSKSALARYLIQQKCQAPEDVILVETNLLFY